MPPEYSVVLAEVRKALGDVTSEAVRQRRARIQAAVSMPNDIALYVLAQQLKLPLHRWVRDPDKLAQVAYFAGQVAERETAAAVPAVKKPTTPEPVAMVQSRPELFRDILKLPTGLLTAKHVREVERMSKRVYPLLYVFENSIREFIDGHLSAAYGENWWNETSGRLVSSPVRKNVAKAQKAEAENRYHSARSARPIYYTMLGDLNLIVVSEYGWRVFQPPRFPRQSWFTELIQGAEVSRNIVAHMNPLQPADINALEATVRSWFKQVADDLPPSVPQ